MIGRKCGTRGWQCDTRRPLATRHQPCHLDRMSERLAAWWVHYVAPVVRWWLGDRASPRALELRMQALQARAENDSRRLREQHDVVLRLRAIVRQYQAQAAADAAEEAQIRQMQAEIRRLAE